MSDVLLHQFQLRKQWWVKVALFASVWSLFCAQGCGHRDRGAISGTVTLTPVNDGEDVLSLMTDHGLVGIHRSDFTLRGVRSLTLTILAITSDEAREWGKMQVDVTGDTADGSIYFALPNSLGDDDKKKQLFGSCTILGEKIDRHGRTNAALDPIPIDSSYSWKGSCSHKQQATRAGEDVILWASYWRVRTETGIQPNHLEEVIAEPMPYDSWNVGEIVRNVQQQKNAIVVLAILKSQGDDRQ